MRECKWLKLMEVDSGTGFFGNERENRHTAQRNIKTDCPVCPLINNKNKKKIFFFLLLLSQGFCAVHTFLFRTYVCGQVVCPVKKNGTDTKNGLSICQMDRPLPCHKKRRRIYQFPDICAVLGWLSIWAYHACGPHADYLISWAYKARFA